MVETKVHKITVFAYGLNDISKYSADEIIELLKSGSADDVIINISESETIEVDYDDAHPFNHKGRLNAMRIAFFTATKKLTERKE